MNKKRHFMGYALLAIMAAISLFNNTDPSAYIAGLIVVTALGNV